MPGYLRQALALAAGVAGAGLAAFGVYVYLPGSAAFTGTAWNQGG